MRALIVALAIAGAAGAASAQGPGTSVAGGEVRSSLTPTVPANARKQAEDAIKHELDDPDSAKFRAVQAIEVAQVRHGAFEAPIDGPVSVVCGQYSARDKKGAYSDYSWFFVAIKRGKVLWAASNETAGSSNEAHDSCEGAGLVDRGADTGAFH